MASLTELGDELYQLPPAQFTAARDTHVQQAKLAGDRGLAAGLAGLKRPTAAAWLVNLLALRHRPLIDELVRLGADIKRTQHPSTGQEGSAGHRESTAPVMRELSTRRKALLSDLLGAAREQSHAAGAPSPTTAQLSEVEATLVAAMSDASAAQAVLAARLVTSLRYSGFGDVAEVAQRTPARSTPPAAPRDNARATTPNPDPLTPDAAVRNAAERDAAEQQWHQANQTLAEAVAAQRAAEEWAEALARQLAEGQSRLAELRFRLAELESQVDEAQRGADEATRGAQVARRNRLTAESAATAADQRRSAVAG